jgi:hypothetical protein
VLYICITITNKQIETMTTFNQSLTLQQATELFNFKGETMFPKTQHNIKMMALVIEAHLKSIR